MVDNNRANRTGIIFIIIMGLSVLCLGVIVLECEQYNEPRIIVENLTYAYYNYTSDEAVYVETNIPLYTIIEK